MKRVFKLSAIAALSLSAYANILMPEISRDGKTRNTSVMAVSQSTRTFAYGDYNSTTFEDDASNEVDVAISEIYGGFSNGKFSMELGYNMQKYESSTSDLDYVDLSILAGFRANDKLTIGFGLISDELTSTTDDTALTIGGTLLVNGTVLGGTITKHNIDAITAEGSYLELTGAFGAAKKDLSWETGIVYKTEGEDDVIVGSRLRVFGNTTYITGLWEFDGSLYYEYGDNQRDVTTDNDYTEIYASFDAKYLVNPTFYITPGFEYYSIDRPQTSADYKTMALNTDFGYRNGKGLDATFGLGYIVSGEMSGEDVDGLGFNINVGHVF